MGSRRGKEAAITQKRRIGLKELGKKESGLNDTQTV